MLLSKEEFRKALDETLRKRIPSDYRLKYGPESDLQHFVADEIFSAERAKVAPHFDALTMMDSRELFMAGAEWGRQEARRVDEIKNAVIDPDKVARHWLQSVTDRRAELLELAGKLICAEIGREAQTISGSAEESEEELLVRGHAKMASKAVAFASAILDAVDKEVAKP